MFHPEDSGQKPNKWIFFYLLGWVKRAHKLSRTFSNWSPLEVTTDYNHIQWTFFWDSIIESLTCQMHTHLQCYTKAIFKYNRKTLENLRERTNIWWWKDKGDFILLMAAKEEENKKNKKIVISPFKCIKFFSDITILPHCPNNR